MIKLKFLLVFIFFAALGLFLVPQKAQAEIAVFRISRPDINDHRVNCIPMSLSENLSARVVGDAGRGCEFEVEVKPIGEWVATGGFYDSPPYAWGADKYYSVSTGNFQSEFSFTCKNNI